MLVKRAGIVPVGRVQIILETREYAIYFGIAASDPRTNRTAIRQKLFFSATGTPDDSKSVLRCLLWLIRASLEFGFL